MERSRKSLFRWCLCAVLFACISMALPSHAQTQADDADDDEKASPTLYVDLSVTPDGVSRVNAMWFTNEAPTTSIKPALQTALALCRLPFHFLLFLGWASPRGRTLLLVRQAADGTSSRSLCSFD
jgi:hypothetical protein